MVLGRVHPPPSHLILLSQFQTAAREDDDHEQHSKTREPFAACHVLCFVRILERGALIPN